MGLHPYALQQCFREAAAELLKYPENEMTIFFGNFLLDFILLCYHLFFFFLTFFPVIIISVTYPCVGEALEILLLRNDFVDAQVLSAIWPVEFDKYKILIVRVDHNGRIESFTSFRSEVGPVDAQGEWAGDELIFTLQVSFISHY